MLSKIQKGGLLFTDVARSFSSCEGTREKDGELGWVDFATYDAPDHPLDPVLPRSARSALVANTSMKPGDVVKVPSPLGFHLVQLVDVMIDVSKKVRVREERSDKLRMSIYTTSNGGSLRSSLRLSPRPSLTLSNTL